MKIVKVAVDGSELESEYRIARRNIVRDLEEMIKHFQFNFPEDYKDISINNSASFQIRFLERLMLKSQAVLEEVNLIKSILESEHNKSKKVMP